MTTTKKVETIQVPEIKAGPPLPREIMVLDDDFDASRPEVKVPAVDDGPPCLPHLTPLPLEGPVDLSARPPAPRSGYEQPHTLTPSELLEMNAIKWWHRIRVGLDAQGQEVYTPGLVDHGPSGGDWPTTRFGVPADLTGKTVLDIGAWDGFFAFEAERGSASLVVAADVPEEAGGNWGGTDGFQFARAMLNSGVEFVQKSVYECGEWQADNDPDPKAGFDVVLCLGVIYHLKYPQRAIEQLFLATKPGGLVVIETACNTDPLLNQYASWSFECGRDNDKTNFWYPTRRGLQAVLEWAGFINVRLVYDMNNQRMTMSAMRPEVNATRP